MIPKLATICLALAAVAFMGMSIAAYYGRPDPMAEISSPELKNYRFEAPLNATDSWSVTPAIGANPSAASHATAYAAILDAYNKENTRLSSETGEMTGLTTELRSRINEIRAEQQEDVAAVERRVAQLQQVVEQTDNQLLQESQRLQKLSVDTRTIRDETARRREDVVRLQHELEELRTDRFRLQQLRRVLTDRLVRLDLENQSLDLRFTRIQNNTK